MRANSGSHLFLSASVTIACLHDIIILKWSISQGCIISKFAWQELPGSPSPSEGQHWKGQQGPPEPDLSRNSSLRGEAQHESPSGVYHLSALQAHLLAKMNLAEAGLGIPRKHPSCSLRKSRAREEQGSTKGVGPGSEVSEVHLTPV
ncbi:hypothetical protein E2C01_045425 [Portunus trituberculatus]|uniref:Uncharacterized protein n=1 Tax=Portunus trituberculatus TaxID=210409 RepID=A0A5B7G167_PORTR|nr:hypothetical protein [Portunus trituberculatus]